MKQATKSAANLPMVLLLHIDLLLQLFRSNTLIHNRITTSEIMERYREIHKARALHDGAAAKKLAAPRSSTTLSASVYRWRRLACGAGAVSLAPVAVRLIFRSGTPLRSVPPLQINRTGASARNGSSSTPNVASAKLQPPSRGAPLTPRFFAGAPSFRAHALWISE